MPGLNPGYLLKSFLLYTAFNGSNNDKRWFKIQRLLHSCGINVTLELSNFSTLNRIKHKPLYLIDISFSSWFDIVKTRNDSFRFGSSLWKLISGKLLMWKIREFRVDLHWFVWLPMYDCKRWVNFRRFSLFSKILNQNEWNGWSTTWPFEFSRHFKKNGSQTKYYLLSRDLTINKRLI